MPFRIRGFLIHLLASCILAFIASYVVFMIWYPSPLAQAIGVTSIVLLLLGVDVIAGPLLTLAVCKEGKKSLKFDLSVIILIQLSAFIYGIHILAQGRPVWIALHENAFHIVRAYEADNEYRQKAKPEYQKLSFTGPRWVAVRLPIGDEKKSVFEGIMKGIIYQERADLYDSINNQATTIQNSIIDLTRLYQSNKSDTVKNVLSKWPRADGYVPLYAQDKILVVLVKKQAVEVVSIVDLAP
jgi:hypothetical protein